MPLKKSAFLPPCSDCKNNAIADGRADGFIAMKVIGSKSQWFISCKDLKDAFTDTLYKLNLSIIEISDLKAQNNIIDKTIH